MLSIAVPSYRGADYVARVLRQLALVDGHVDYEVIVLCNGWEPAADLIDEFPFASFHVSHTILDPDQSHCKVIELCTRTYVLLLGDDDLVNSSVFSLFKELISISDVDLVVLSSESPSGLALYEDAGEFFRDYFDSLTLGAFIFKRSLFVDEGALRGTAHAYTGALLGLFTKKNILVYILKYDSLLGRVSVSKTYAGKIFRIYFLSIPKWFRVIEREASRISSDNSKKIRIAWYRYLVSMLSPSFIWYLIRTVIRR